MENKTKDEILDSEFATQMEPGMVRDGIIKAMESYALQESDKAVEAYKSKLLDRIAKDGSFSFKESEYISELIDSTPIR